MPDAPMPTDTAAPLADAAAPDPRLADLERQLEQARADLAAARQDAALANRARQLQLLLVQARAIDLDAATLLAQQAIGDAQDPDLAQVVRDLRRQKPHLFRPALTATAPGRPDGAPDDATPTDLAAYAARTGDRGALLMYLRARRR